MNLARTRYGLPVICYHWVVGVAGVLLLLYCTFYPPFPQQPILLTAFFLFFVMHVIASFLHFQYARLNVVITFESSFTTATLLVFGGLPAVWVSVIGIIVGSIKRVIERRFILHKAIPLSYDLGIIVFNSGMVATMWLAASWMYIVLFKGNVPLAYLDLAHIGSIILMFIGMSVINHIILFASSFLQGFNPVLFLRKALIPAFVTEFAIIPFGVVMALSFTSMGTLVFLFLGSTLLLSNAVLRNLSIIRYDQEEKLRQLTSLNRIRRQVISVRTEDAVLRLLMEDVGQLVEPNPFFLAETDEKDGNLAFTDLTSGFASIAKMVAEAKQPLLIENARKDAPERLKEPLLNEQIRSCICIPMMASNQLYGVLGVCSREASAFKQEHLQILGMIADEAALALENSRLYRDLTDKVSELERLNQELLQLDRLKTEFLANVSHELRTPLTSIKGYVDYIKKEKLGPITPSQSEGLSVAQRNILRLQRLINDLLDYTKLEFKRTPLHLIPCSLDQLWTEAQDQYTELISKKKLSVHLTIPVNLPLLFLDTPKFLHVLSNLISNAVKFTSDEGAIWFEAKVKDYHSRYYQEEVYRNSCRVEALVPIEITVRDSGIGIPQEAIPKIFGRFYQVDSSNTRKYGGTGLGLALVKSILDADGNPVTVESLVGEGTTFRMIVPGIQAADVPTAVKATHLEQSHAEVKCLT